MDKAKTPDRMRDLPMSDESMVGATGGAAVSRASLERGFTPVSDEDTAMDAEVASRAGQPGFISRADWWNR